MKSAKLIVELSDIQSKLNVVIQSVKGNSFTNTKKTNVAASGTDAINYIKDAIDELNTFENLGNTSKPTYVDTDPENTNVPIVQALLPDDKEEYVANKLSSTVSEALDFINKQDDENIVDVSNNIFTRTNDYNTAILGAITALETLNGDIVA